MTNLDPSKRFGDESAPSGDSARSLTERAPQDFQINWRGDATKRWAIRLECTIASADEAEAICEIVRLLSAASDQPDPAGETPNA